MPPAAMFSFLTDTAFHASFLTEEKRRPGFRLIYCCEGDLEAELAEHPWFKYARVILLASPLPFKAADLIRIAPAADLVHTLVCVYPNEETGDLEIWGLLDVGTGWWRFLQREDVIPDAPPSFLAVTSTAPGELVFSVSGRILLVLSRGQLSYPTTNPIQLGPVSDFLDGARSKLHEDVLSRLEREVFDEEGYDDDYPQTCYNRFLERILTNVHRLGTGGTVLLVPDAIGRADPRISELVSLKYQTVQNDSNWNALVRSIVLWDQYYQLFYRLRDGPGHVTRAKFRQFLELEQSQEGIKEEMENLTRAIASLASVDGALVMTTSFEVLGFGGEILAGSRSLRSVSEISDKSREVQIEKFGTRHRSAFRFCTSFVENGVAFVFSSDGGSRAAMRHGADLLTWPNVTQGPWGL